MMSKFFKKQFVKISLEHSIDMFNFVSWLRQVILISSKPQGMMSSNQGMQSSLMLIDIPWLVNHLLL